jgi:hypothetical protein
MHELLHIEQFVYAGVLGESTRDEPHETAEEEEQTACGHRILRKNILRTQILDANARNQEALTFNFTLLDAPARSPSIRE